MNRKSFRLLDPLLLALVLAGALACAPGPARVADGEDPLAALRAGFPTSRFREPYWAEQCHRKTAAWQAALAFCRAEGRDPVRYPNCQHVRIVSRWDEPLRITPPFYSFDGAPGPRGIEPPDLAVPGSAPSLPVERP